MSKSHALWLRWPWALPLLNLCSRVIWPNKASIRPFQVYYVWNNCLLSPPYCVAVETDEHLTAVGQGCHDNRTNSHLCVVGAIFLTRLALWLVHDMLSSARHYGSREMEWSWLQVLPHPLQIRDFPEPGRALNLSRTKEPDLSKQVLRQLSCHCSYCQSGLILAVKPSLTGYSRQGQMLLLELTHYSFYKFS